MASLETLTIEINGNATQAAEGIEQLTISLSSLGRAVQSSIGGLRELSTALRDIRTNADGIGNVFSALSGASTARAASGANRITNAMNSMNQAAQTAQNGMQYVAPVADEISNSTQEATTNAVQYANTLNTTANVSDRAAENTRELSSSIREVGRASTTVRATQRHMSGLFSTISRMAKTMVLRMAIKSLIKVAKQGLQNYYQYSKSINGTFYKATQELQKSAIVSGNQIGAALGTLIASIAPLLNQLLSIITAVAEALTMLFALLGGQTTYTKAVAGMNSVGKAAGGAGGKIKELLADFDELNVISQESSGGGGGGGNGFGYDYEEVPLPQWMLEWKPLIEALLGAGLGALALSKLMKLFDWLKKLLGLGDTTGAKNLKDIFNNIDKKLKLNTSDLDEALLKIGAITAALEGANLVAQELKKTFLEIKTALALMDVVKALLALLLGSLLGDKTITIKVDTKPFDDFKKELEEWQPEAKKIVFKYDTTEFFEYYRDFNHWLQQNDYKTIAFKLDTTNLWEYYNELKPWLEEKSVKTVEFKVDTTHMWDYIKDVKDWLEKKLEKIVEFKIDTTKLWQYVNDIKEWLNEKMEKVIGISIDESAFKQTKQELTTWLETPEKKSVAISIDDIQYVSLKKEIDKWVNKSVTKTVGVNILTAYLEFLIYSALIDIWAYRRDTKTILIDIRSSYNSDFIPITNTITSWCRTIATKTIAIVISNIDSFRSFANELTKWANQTLTKTVNVVIYETTKKTTTTNNNDNKQKTIWDNITDYVNDLNESIKNDINKVFNNNKKYYVDGGWAASGGFPDSGDLFFANENGVPEYIASMGNRTAVANPEQIVEGISKGVADGQAEQNALLRRQNELLQGILEKDSSVRINASAALGRVARQSLDMYSGMTGG